MKFLIAVLALLISASALAHPPGGNYNGYAAAHAGMPACSFSAYGCGSTYYPNGAAIPYNNYVPVAHGRGGVVNPCGGNYVNRGGNVGAHNGNVNGNLYVNRGGTRCNPNGGWTSSQQSANIGYYNGQVTGNIGFHQSQSD